MAVVTEFARRTDHDLSRIVTPPLNVETVVDDRSYRFCLPQRRQRSSLVTVQVPDVRETLEPKVYILDLQVVITEQVVSCCD